MMVRDWIIGAVEGLAVGAVLIAIISWALPKPEKENECTKSSHPE